MIEVELRGRITKGLQETLKEFGKEAKFLKEKDRFSLIYWRDEVTDDARDVKDDPVDIRIKVTNRKEAEITMKYGKWGVEEKRHEISIPIPLDKVSEAVDFLKYLGWKHGVVMATKTFSYGFKGVEFALVKAGKETYFEAEKVVENEGQAERAREKILDACAHFNLKIFSEEEFLDLVNSFNNAPGAKFNFDKDNFKDIKERFKEFF